MTEHDVGITTSNFVSYRYDKSSSLPTLHSKEQTCNTFCFKDLQILLNVLLLNEMQILTY